MRFNPFKAVRPDPRFVREVAAVPYDVVNRDEAAALAEGNPRSFLHVGRSDIDLPPETDPHDHRVYTGAREALERMIAEGTLLQDDEPSLFLYRLVRKGRAQVGVVGCVHIDDYETNIIRKHEKTRPDKEDDRTRHVLTLNANAEPVFLTYRARPDIDRLADSAMQQEPLYDFVADDDVRHTVWTISDTRRWSEVFGTVPLAYVADGHHRSASAWRAGRERRAANPGHHGAEEFNWFLAALFPEDQVEILPYHRLVRDLNGQSPDDLRQRLREIGRLEETDTPLPEEAGTLCLFFDDQWYRLTFPSDDIDSGDAIASLDVSLLHDRVLGPVFGIGDPRTDERIDFVGGSRGTSELERRVRSGAHAVAVAMFPTSVEQLLNVSDAGLVMPPKSTWFEPKLRSGLFVHLLD